MPKHAGYDNQNDNDRNPRSLVLNLGPKPVEAQSYDAIQTFGELSIVNSDAPRGDHNETIQTVTMHPHTASKGPEDERGSLQEYRDHRGGHDNAGAALGRSSVATSARQIRSSSAGDVIEMDNNNKKTALQ